MEFAGREVSFCQQVLGRQACYLRICLGVTWACCGPGTVRRDTGPLAQSQGSLITVWLLLPVLDDVSVLAETHRSPQGSVASLWPMGATKGGSSEGDLSPHCPPSLARSLVSG